MVYGFGKSLLVLPHNRNLLVALVTNLATFRDIRSLPKAQHAILILALLRKARFPAKWITFVFARHPSIEAQMPKPHTKCTGLCSEGGGHFFMKLWRQTAFDTPEVECPRT